MKAHALILMTVLPVMFISLVAITGCKPSDSVAINPLSVQGVTDVRMQDFAYLILNLNDNTSVSVTDTVSLNLPDVPTGVAHFFVPSPYMTTRSGSTTISFINSDTSTPGTYKQTLEAVSKSGFRKTYDFTLTVPPFNGYKLGNIVQCVGDRAPANNYYLTWYSLRNAEIEFMFKHAGPPAPGVYNIVYYSSLNSDDEVAIVQQDAEPDSGLWFSSGKDKQTLTITVNNGKYTVLVPPTEMLSAPAVTKTLSGKLIEL